MIFCFCLGRTRPLVFMLRTVFLFSFQLFISKMFIFYRAYDLFIFTKNRCELDTCRRSQFSVNLKANKKSFQNFSFALNRKKRSFKRYVAFTRSLQIWSCLSFSYETKYKRWFYEVAQYFRIWFTSNGTNRRIFRLWNLFH